MPKKTSAAANAAAVHDSQFAAHDSQTASGAVAPTVNRKLETVNSATAATTAATTPISGEAALTSPSAFQPFSPSALSSQVARALDRLRARHPLVHCMTNQVVKDITANVLLAAGAAPAMVEHPDEAAEFAAIADALLINLGTLDDAQMQAMRRAIPSATNARKPWVLDPVAVGPLTTRTRFAREILQYKPTLIRGNASEIIALAGHTAQGRGVDSGDRPDAALDAAAQLAAQTNAAVLVTGPVDYALDATGATLTCANGHELLTRVTGVGCAQGALAAALLPVAETPLAAAAAAALIIALAGEIAAARAPRPGSFRVALLDELDRLDAPTIRQRARLG